MKEKTIEKFNASQITRIRKQQNLKQAELAELVDLAPESISRIERGESVPSVKTLEKIGHALKTPIRVFFSSEPYSSPQKGKRENELSKVMLLLQNKKIEDIKLGYRVLKNLFEQLKNYRPARK